MNKKYTGASGYFSRKLNLLNVDTVLDLDPHSDCHTKHYLRYHIDDMESLSRIEGRYYKIKKNSPFLRCVKITDTHLIGKTIYMRSPTLCKGDKICRKCYGELYNINNEINVGLVACTTISSRFTQNILSAKHSLMTNSKKIEFGDDFDKYFILDGNAITLDSNNIEQGENLYITIRAKDLQADLMDEYEDENANVPISILEVLTCGSINITTDDPDEVLYNIKEANGMTMKLSEYMTKLVNKYDKHNKYIMIPLNSIRDDMILFEFDVANHELTKTLNQVKALLEKKDHEGCTNIEDMIYTFNRLLIDGKIYSHLVHAEVICRNLMRDNKNIMERPDLDKDELEYQLLTVQKALMTNPSPLVSLSFERVEEQLKGVLLYRKSKPSLIDKLFMTKYKEFYNVDICKYKKDAI